MFKYHFTFNSYEILVTNMEKMWFDQLDGDAILKKNKVINPCHNNTTYYTYSSNQNE